MPIINEHRNLRTRELPFVCGDERTYDALTRRAETFRARLVEGEYCVNVGMRVADTRRGLLTEGQRVELADLLDIVDEADGGRLVVTAAHRWQRMINEGTLLVGG